MGTPCVRGARPLTLAILLALLLHGDGASNQGLEEERFESPYAGVLWFTTAWARNIAEAKQPWYAKTAAANETDPVSAVIAKRMAAVGSTYGFARLWLSGRCPRQGNDGTISGITRRRYLRELRLLEEQLRLPPPSRETPHEKAQCEVLQFLSF